MKKIKNTIQCPECKSKNTFYNLTCQNCKIYLREKVVNIDLAHTLWQIIETPIKAFRNIIFAENKNFLLVLILFIAIKFSLSSITFCNAFIKRNFYGEELFPLLLSLFLAILLLLVFPFIIITTNKIFHFRSKYKDMLATFVFAHSPFLFGLLILTIVEYALFGKSFFTFEPSPFCVKKTVAYVIFSLEGILFLLSFINSIVAFYAHTTRKVYSVIMGFLFEIIFLALQLSSIWIVTFI